MLGLLPTTNADHARSLLEDRASHLHQVTNAQTVTDAFNLYLSWANTSAQVLGGIVTPDELDRLVLTRRYWALLAIAPANVGLVLWDLIRTEIAERVVAFTKAVTELDSYTARPGALAMIVPDTNVWMRHSGEIDALPWFSYLNMRAAVPITIWVPSVVLEELDSLKRDRGNMNVAGQPIPRRHLARRALNRLTDWFEDPLYPHHLVSVPPDRPDRPIEIRLLPEARDHVRLSRVDAELIDIAQRLSPFCVQSFVMTYDVALTFRARAVLQAAILLDEPDEP